MTTYMVKVPTTLWFRIEAESEREAITEAVLFGVDKHTILAYSGCPPARPVAYVEVQQ